jgi:hypothetical protein
LAHPGRYFLLVFSLFKLPPQEHAEKQKSTGILNFVENLASLRVFLFYLKTKTIGLNKRFLQARIDCPTI